MKGKLAIAMFGQKRLSREGGIEIVVKELCTRMNILITGHTCYFFIALSGLKVLFIAFYIESPTIYEKSDCRYDHAYRKRFKLSHFRPVPLKLFLPEVVFL